MKAAGHVVEVVDRTDQLDTADTTVESDDTTVRVADYTTVAVDNAHTASVFSMNRP